jgi:hypothetical protein
MNIVDELTDEEMRVMINIKITLAYPKMMLDEKRITSYNYHLYSDLLSFCMEQFLIKKSLDYQYKVCVTDDETVAPRPVDPETLKLVTNLYSMIDKAVKKGVIHRNTAARKKSKIGLLSKQIQY